MKKLMDKLRILEQSDLIKRRIMNQTNVEQLELLLVKEMEGKRTPAKRVDIVSLRLVKESSMLYKNRSVSSPEDGYDLLKQFLGEVDREYFIVICLDTKNQPTAINICHIGSLNASHVHPREVMKPAILSNAASILIRHNHPSGQPLYRVLLKIEL